MLISNSKQPTQMCFAPCEDSIKGKPCKCTGFPQSLQEMEDFEQQTEFIKNQNDDYEPTIKHFRD